VLSVLTGCGQTLGEDEPYSPPGDSASLFSSDNLFELHNLWTVTDGITLRLLQDSYPPNTESMTLVLENRSDSVMAYGQGWSFEIFEDEEWQSLETVEEYAFTMEGYTLFDHDRKTFSIGTWLLKEPLSKGIYRVTGCSLRVAPDDQNLSYSMDYTEYPPYQLEFVVSETATPEPEKSAVEQFAKWQLPKIEDWQHYTPWDCVNMYNNAGMQVWQYVQGENGLLMVLYRNTHENEYYNTGELLLADVIDRKTGMRYVVFDGPTVQTDAVTPYKDGFKIDCGDVLFCFLDENGSINLVQNGG